MRVLAYLSLASACFGATVDTFVQPRVLAFEARGQRYVSHGPGYSLSLTAAGVTLDIRGQSVRISLLGASPASSLEPLDRMPGKATYLVGDSHASYSLYGRVLRRDAYPGIDAVFHANQERLEYDFDVAPHSDPGQIRLAFDGVDEIHIDDAGNLILRSGTYTMRQPKPFASQISSQGKEPVNVAYVLDSANHAHFRLGAYDHMRPLVIDPEIVFDTAFGGSGTAAVTGFARDLQGSLYVTGWTNSPDFPTTNSLQNQSGSAPLITSANGGKTWTNVFVGSSTSVNVIAGTPSSPQVIYVVTNLGTFKSADGGATFSATGDKGLSGTISVLAVDAASATTLYAATPQGVFVSTDGASSWEASTNGLSGTGIATLTASPKQAGVVFAEVQNPEALFRSTNGGKSWTQLNVPQPNGQPVLITAMVVGTNGSIVAATGLGPLLLSPDDGNTWTTGANLGVTSDHTLVMSPSDPNTVYLVFNSVVYKSTDGGRTFATVFTSPRPEQYHLAIDPRNPANLFMVGFDVVYRTNDAGKTWSQMATWNPISTNAVFVSGNSTLFLAATIMQNGFVTKWSPDGSQMLYSTYFGGAGNTTATAIAVDAAGGAYITGETDTPNFPTTRGAYQSKAASGVRSIFVSKFSPDGSQLAYSALIGVNSAGSTAIAVDSEGEAVITGSTQDSGYPGTPGAFQTALVPTCAVQPPIIVFLGPSAAFVTKFSASGDSLVYSTFLGGSCASYGNNVTIDVRGNAWVVGSTTSPDFPLTSDALQAKYGGGNIDGDGFLARFSPAGNLEYSTYIGGPGYDSMNALTFDSSGNLYVTCETAGLSQPSSPHAYQPKASAACYVINIGPGLYEPQGNAAVLKLDPMAHSVLGLTYLGAPGCLIPSSISVDSAGEPWIAGGIHPAGNSLPTISPVELGGASFISKFSADFTQLLFSTNFDRVTGFVLDPSGHAYLGGTTSTNSAYVAEIDSKPSPITINSVAKPSINLHELFLSDAPGEVIKILGANMGPVAQTPGIIQSGFLATTVAGVQVTFDGVAVPLLAVSAREIELVTPFEIAGRSTTSIQVLYNGSKSNPVQLVVAPANFEILAVMNQDFTINSASNPAKAGSVMEIYLAGVGNSDPPAQDGQVNAAPFAAFPLPIQAGWYTPNSAVPNVLPIRADGAAPGLAAGIFQINFDAPPQTTYVSLSEVIAPNTYTGGTAFQVYVQK